MITLFVMASLEAWPTLMIDMLDGPEFSHELGPIEDGNFYYGAGFTIVFIVLGSFFFMNLFVGVIFDEFDKQNEIERGKEKNLS